MFAPNGETHNALMLTCALAVTLAEKITLLDAIHSNTTTYAVGKYYR
jgi:hypothetical protein